MAIIIAWSGSLSNIPSGWTLCDGSDGTPDLTDRFIRGSSSSGATGGTSGSISANGSHTHGLDTTSSYNQAYGSSIYGEAGTASENSVTPSTGSETRPPFYEVAFIMKVE